jgi:4-carboxymuconolactone decarboxylase
MRLSEPRVPALDESEWDDKAREVLKPFIERGNVLNIFRTLANHPDLARRWMVFANHVLGKSALDVRERELVILRIGYLCQSGYEWGQHVLIARQAGMSDAEIRSAKTGPDTPGLSELDRLLLKATDELHDDAHVSDETWNGLSGHLTRQQLMDLVFTVGQYNLVSMALNSFGVQADEGLPGWDV